MQEFVVQKSKPLKGSVKIDGAKNAVLPIIASTLLVNKGISILHNVPDLTDVHNISNLLKHLGAKVEYKDNTLTVDATEINKTEAPYELVSKMRASFLVLGPLLARFNTAKISMPGGCAIGARPIDLHLKGFEKLNAKIDIDGNTVTTTTECLLGGEIELDFPSVGATQNIVMAATLANGTTILRNAAREPEIVDFITFLNKLGAKITGEGTNTIVIEGVKELVGAEYTVMFDRIEAMTFMVASAITKGDITLENVDPVHLSPVTEKLIEAGCQITVGEDSKKVRVVGPKELKPVNITTMPHPGFPTDAQAQFMAVNMLASGKSSIKETVFENRFMHVAEYNKMGANIKIESDNRTSTINGVKNISGAKVKATDLRAGASLILCGLVADGETRVGNIHHVLRGYVNIQDKLKKLGANVELVTSK